MAVRPPPDALGRAYRTARAVGGAMVLSLAVFAVVVAQIRRANAPFAGFAPGVPHDLLRWIFAAFALADLWLVRFMRTKILANAALPPVQRLLSAAIVGLANCEAIALYGFVLFVLAGRVTDYYVFAGLALLGFALYFPRRQAWEDWLGSQPRR
ncbi:MAG: hypothetical protein HYV94_18095 [Candidatus Rokubacteria bacterium]|nr:hypothetical protein [Candidatus Rokubacteria bacterium]MBI2493992.1 hypothetical protein [Candidatus Rokubacteria bacterium]